MRLKFLLSVATRVKGFSLLFEPGKVYDLDPVTVATHSLLQRGDGYGHPLFELVKEVASPAGPLPTPDEVHADARDERLRIRGEEAKQKSAKKKKEADEAAARRRADFNERMEGAPKGARLAGSPKEPTPVPEEEGEGQPSEPKEKPKKPAGKLQGRLAKRPK